MREHARAAILAPVVQKRQIAAAFVAQGVKRTVAEKAVEIALILSFVAGKILAGRIAEIGVVFAFDIIVFVPHIKASLSIIRTPLIRTSDRI